MKISDSTFEEVKEVARYWQKKIEVSREAQEQEFHDMMLKMLKNPVNKVFLIELLTKVFAPTTPIELPISLNTYFKNMAPRISFLILNRFLYGCFETLASI